MTFIAPCVQWCPTQQKAVCDTMCLGNAMHIRASVFINDNEPGLHSIVDPVFQQRHYFAAVFLVLFSLSVADHGEDEMLFRIDDQQCAATAAVSVAAWSQVLRLVLQADAVFHV